MPRLDINDALEVLLENAPPTTARIIQHAIDEINRLRTVEVAALELVDSILQPGDVALPTEKHPLVKAIRGDSSQRA